METVTRARPPIQKLGLKTRPLKFEEVWMAEIVDELLIALDFTRANNSVIHARKGILYIQSEEIPCKDMSMGDYWFVGGGLQ